ncbi:type II secretion system GspH family protein [Enterovibrio sp. ZSDZ35]|uniref:Type II secretion system GspH family protein n=1 Tax=Enterovibrio qingdaonensis TaxID=2899818 RepID=A0ABT5QK63_9GAMM|nr:type II secretion system protein [Enterovibrio sp. ZSDZ35]MDD1780676.1 type II secretion system GspH family protein [Enterovibrio sp. ZSDZ35]
MKHQGFTLVEIVCVVAILTILSVTAVPRFIAIVSDSRASSLENVASAVESAITMFRTQAMMAGATDKLTINGETIKVGHDNYPIFSRRNNRLQDQVNALVSLGSNFRIASDEDTRDEDGGFVVMFRDLDEDVECYFEYEPPESDDDDDDDDDAEFEVEDDDC